jgi:E3 ubiquitin-protein ligase SIAH1
MAEHNKRASQPQNGDHGHKRANNGVVKQEQQEGGQEEGEVRQDSSAAVGGLVVTTDDMGESQISLSLSLALFHCRACRRPLKPPTFKVSSNSSLDFSSPQRLFSLGSFLGAGEKRKKWNQVSFRGRECGDCDLQCGAGHVVCFACRTTHGQVCAAGAAHVACAEVDAFVRDAKQACAFEEFGCRRPVVYHEAEDHQRACPWAPCYCPCPGCDFFSAPATLPDHLATAHGCPVTEVSYGKPHVLAVPPPARGWHALVGEEDRCAFLLSACAVGAGAAAAAVSLVCVRANGGATQYRCKLWAEVPSNKDNMTMMMAVVASSNLSGGLPPAADQGMFLAVPQDIMHDVSGDAPLLKVRIDKIGAAAAKATTPPGRSSRRLQ